MKTQILNIIDNNIDKNRYNRGFVYFKNNQVYNDYAKIENNIATFYGAVRGDGYNDNHTSMVMIDLNTRVILNMNCDCNESISRNNKPQICPHMIGVILKGLDSLENETTEEDIHEGITINPKVNLNLSQSKNSIKLELNIDGIDSIQYRRIFNAYKENKRLYRLPSGNYLDLKDENLERSLKIIDSLGIYNDFDNMKIPLEKALYLGKLIEEEDLEFINGRKYIDNVLKMFNKSEKYDIPKNLKATLRNYQIEGYKFFTDLSSYEFGGILADEMGLGKTVQTITFVLSKPEASILIITPTSLIHNWKSEIDKFAPSLKVGMAYGSKDKREEVVKNYKDYNVILTTYGTLKNDIEKYESINFDYTIIDEAQNIKNPDAIITKTVKSINSKVKFALTGTPIENNLTELWSIFDFVMPGYLYNKTKFENIFIKDDKNMLELKRLIRPFMLRRTKKEVITELPDKIEQKHYIELSKEHRQAYNGYVKLIKNKIKESDNKITVFSYLTKLRQMCLAPESIVKNYSGKNSKLNTCLNIIKENEDKKILVFSQFTGVLKLIQKELENSNINYSYLDGKTNPKERLSLVERFNTTDNNRVFLISLKAGGTGLNLTSASIVIHFDPWWNPSVENQASDRAHRIGQKNVVNILKLIAKDSVEERVIGLQEAKKELIDDIIDGNLENSNVLKTLSKDELIDLFID